jgi:acyl-CoA reductase-like NAD-dependent aldehyde dehydrogenase
MNDLFSDISYIGDDGSRRFNILINGCWQCLKSTRTFDVTNPATGELIGRVPQCDPEDVRSAIESARNNTDIKGYSPLRRLEIMERAREILMEHAELFAETITRESGKPIAISRGEVTATAERLRLTMEETRVLYGEYLPGEWVEDTQNKFAIVIRKPLGVVAAISPFNYPLFIAAAKIIPAILAGNTVIAKPASETPLSLILFVRVLEAAGMPVGTINIVSGKGNTIGDVIIESPDIAAISFTGSTSVGEYIASKAGIKKLHLELGGKAAAIVLEDANLDNAARQVCRGSFRNSGQRCDAISRVLVDERVRKPLLERIMKEASAYTTGDPMDPSTPMGTVINDKAVKHIDELVSDAVKKGAHLLRGGGHQGLFYEATVIDGVTAEMRIAREEIFGPVIPIISVKDENEALELSNSSEYGLDSCVFTENINRAIRISRELQDGSVTINAAPAHGVGHFPFGGNKKSGLGREGLKYSIDELTKLHTIIFTQYN